MSRISFLLLLPLLAGCNAHSKEPASGDQNVSIHADESGHVSFNLPIAQGEVKIPAGIMHAGGNIDIDGVKLMPGSSVSGFNMDDHGNGATVEMSFTAPASPDAVRSYYLDQFRKRRAEVALAGNAVNGRSEDGSPFTIQVSPAGSGSQGKIVIKDKH